MPLTRTDHMEAACPYVHHTLHMLVPSVLNMPHTRTPQAPEQALINLRKRKRKNLAKAANRRAQQQKQNNVKDKNETTKT